MRIFAQVKRFGELRISCIFFNVPQAGVHLAVHIGRIFIANAKALVMGWPAWVDVFDDVQRRPEIGAAAAALITQRPDNYRCMVFKVFYVSHIAVNNGCLYPRVLVKFIPGAVAFQIGFGQQVNTVLIT